MRVTVTPQDERGFTLMELVVAMGIFATVVVSASDIFLIASQSQRKIFSLERTQADARFALEAMSREIRSGRIDYAYYLQRAADGGASLQTPDTELALIDEENSHIRFFRSADVAECINEQSTPCLMVAVDANAPVPITSSSVAVRNSAFYIAPDADPFTFDVVDGEYPSNQQPRVTMVLVVESTAGRDGERAIIPVQTTVTSRIYRR